jgi:hypothetical protein
MEPKKAVIAILITNKADFNQNSSDEIKICFFIFIKGAIH